MKKHTSTYLVGSEDLPWQQSGMDIEPLPSVTTNPTPKLSSKSIGRTCRATKTSAKYEASYTQESLFLQEDSHASHSVVPGSNEARMITATSGQKCCALYGKQSQLGSLVRMLLASSTWHSTRCVLTWKQKATKSNRLLFQLAPSTRRTEEIRCWIIAKYMADSISLSEGSAHRSEERECIGGRQEQDIGQRNKVGSNPSDCCEDVANAIMLTIGMFQR
jgi:hypothetical protein